jgi:hypothetical protein
MPIQIRIRIGIGTMLIGMRILPEHMFESREIFFTYIHCNASFSFPFCALILSIFDSMRIEIFMQKLKNACLRNLYRSGSGKMRQIRPDPDPVQQCCL